MTPPIKSVWKCQECGKRIPCCKVITQDGALYSPLSKKERSRCLLGTGLAAFKLKKGKK